MIEMDKMDVTFEKLTNRVIESMKLTDLETIFNTLKEINEPTIITGVGGSSVVAAYLEKVLNKKNHIITKYCSPRDLNRIDLKGFKNVIAVSYSGGNIGVDYSFKNNLKKYLLSKNERENIIPLKYAVNETEFSYISISATLIPMAVCFLYYSDNNLELLKEILESKAEYFVKGNNIYEVIYGVENKTAVTMLESTMTEAGLGALVMHDKYNYCHGRLNLNENYHNELIYFEDDSSLDKVFKENLKKNYNNITYIDNKYTDSVINDYYHTYMMLLLCKKIAECKDIDLSSIKEASINDTYYLFKEDM